MGKILLMSDIELSKDIEKALILKALKDDFYPLDDVWEITSESEKQIQISTSLFKYTITFKDKADHIIAKVRPSWTSKGYAFILASLPFLMIPWTLFSLLSLNPKMDKANRRIDRLLKNKYPKKETAISA